MVAILLINALPDAAIRPNREGSGPRIWGMSFLALPHSRREWVSACSALALAIGALSLAGCATTPAPPGSRFVVSASQAQFYRNGPAQDAAFDSPQTSSLRTIAGDDKVGPDAQLPKGSSVTMLKREIGFSKVMTSSGAIGYVSNDQLQPAPAITRATAPSFWKQPATIPSRNRVQPSRRPTEQLDMSDLDLPLPG